MQNSDYMQWVFTSSKSTIKAKTRCVNFPKLTKKRHQSNLIDIGTLRNIEFALMSLLLTLRRFHTFS